MTTFLIRPRLLPVVLIATFLAAALTLAAAAAPSVRAGQPVACSILISSTSSPVPAESATVIVGEAAQVNGTGFTPNATLDITVVLNGVPQATFPQTTDGAGSFILQGSFDPSQVGNWTLTAADSDVCSDTVTITVVAAAVATPTPEALPNAAMIPAGPASSGGTTLAVAILGAALLALAVASLRTRRLT